MKIEGKRVVITGTNRGLGRDLVLACLGAGAGEVVAGARNRASLESLQADAGPLASRLVPVQLDVTSNEDIARVAGLGRADIVFNIAAFAVPGGALNLSFEQIEEEVQVNYLGLLRMVRAFAPAMREHKDGLIVNVSSQLAKASMPIYGTYCATKAAVMSLGHALRGDLAHHGVRVVTVFPGAMDTEMTRYYQGPKTPPAAAAAEVLQAIDEEPDEVPVCDDARNLFAAHASDPKALQEGMLKYRA
jgi:NAD(P)-dependent dehydrogenase (short-subunit alcohol dehydrogenase family)